WVSCHRRGPERARQRAPRQPSAATSRSLGVLVSCDVSVLFVVKGFGHKTSATGRSCMWTILTVVLVIFFQSSFMLPTSSLLLPRLLASPARRRPSRRRSFSCCVLAFEKRGRLSRRRPVSAFP